MDFFLEDESPLEDTLVSPVSQVLADAVRASAAPKKVVSIPPPAPKHDTGTSEGRYRDRIDRWCEAGGPYPKLRHHFYWLVHNVVAHSILALSPDWSARELHELTSQWLNRSTPMLDADTAKIGRWIPISQQLTIPSRFWWVFHNLVAHSLIGFVPCGPTFRLHDWSAKKMNVPGWV